MKSLIVYSSQTGNTRKLADAVREALTGETAVFPVDKAPSGKDYDMIFIGFWLMGGKPDPKTCEYLAGMGAGDRLFLFVTHGAASGSDHVNKAVGHAVDIAGDADVAGVFTCQGEVNPSVLEKVRQKPQPPVWIEDAAAAAGHPDADDLSALKEMVKRL